MYITHPVFETPADSGIRVWRYQDVAKFVACLSTRSLFFARADRFADQYEGSLPQANLHRRREDLLPIRTAGPQIARDLKDHLNIVLSSAEANALAENAASHVESRQIQENQEYRRFTCINCWHINEVESLAMWKLYCQTREAVAIQSTFDRLVRSLGGCTEEVYGGLVKYTNYDTDAIPTGNDFYRFIYKLSSFSHERELRLIIQRHPPINTETKSVEWHVELFPDGGVSIPVDVDIVVERILLSPTAPPWFEKVVRSLVEKYGCNFPVERSVLIRPPKF